MNIIVESEGERRNVTSDLKIYGSAEDLKIVAGAIESALKAGLAQGWVTVGEVVKESVPLIWGVTADEQPVYPFAAKTAQVIQ